MIPEAARQRVLVELHEGHPGISRMKGISRGTVWWPGINQDIEQQVKSCHQCQVNQKAPSRAPLHPWEWPEKPWSRVHLDYAGPWMGKMFLIAVDAHSKWLEVEIVPAATSTHTITKLRAMLATHGLPEIIVTDNGNVFTSSEFKEFLKKNGIRHLTSPPYHPSSNGLAERYVQTFKIALKKQHVEDIQCQLSRFLFRYRTTPQATTGISPCEMLMGRHLRTHLDNLHPNLSTRIQTRQAHQKQDHDGTSHERSFDVGDKVFVHNFTGNLKWIPGIVTHLRSPIDLKIRLVDGRTVRRHIDHVRIRTVPHQPSEDNDLVFPESVSEAQEETPPPTESQYTPPPLRRSACNHGAPVRYPNN